MNHALTSRIFAVGLLLTLASMPTAALCDEPPRCTAPPGTLEVKSQRDFPAAIAADLSSHIIDYQQDGSPKMADPGQPFASTDLISRGLPNRRLIFAWSVGPRWVIGYEVGARGYHYEMVVYQLSSAGDHAEVLANVQEGLEICGEAAYWLTHTPDDGAMKTRFW